MLNTPDHQKWPSFKVSLIESILCALCAVSQGIKLKIHLISVMVQLTDTFVWVIHVFFFIFCYFISLKAVSAFGHFNCFVILQNDVSVCSQLHGVNIFLWVDLKLRQQFWCHCLLISMQPHFSCSFTNMCSLTRTCKGGNWTKASVKWCLSAWNLFLAPSCCKEQQI